MALPPDEHRFQGWAPRSGLHLSLQTLMQQAPGASHHPALLAALAAELRCEPGAIVDLELNVCDTQPGAIGGALGPTVVRKQIT